jgi:hypothetical protein
MRFVGRVPQSALRSAQPYSTSSHTPPDERMLPSRDCLTLNGDEVMEGHAAYALSTHHGRCCHHSLISRANSSVNELGSVAALTLAHQQQRITSRADRIPLLRIHFKRGKLTDVKRCSLIRRQFHRNLFARTPPYDCADADRSTQCDLQLPRHTLLTAFDHVGRMFGRQTASDNLFAAALRRILRIREPARVWGKTDCTQVRGKTDCDGS